MPSKLDPHLALIETWLATEPQLTAIAIVGRLAERHPGQFGNKQHSIVQRLLQALRQEQQRTARQHWAKHHHDRQSHAPGLWTARAMKGPTRPQALFSSKPLHRKTTFPRFRSGNICR